MSESENATTEGTEAAEMGKEELARLLHIDEDNEEELANASLYLLAAEEYLAGAGIKRDYASGLYRQIVIALTARALERPDALTKFSDMPGSGIVSLVANLRAAQAVREAEE